MITIKGVFKSQGLQEFSGKKKITLANGEKDQNGKYTNAYYDLWINDKVSNMIESGIKQDIADKKAVLEIEGYLKVKKNDKYTNLIIYPTSVKKFQKRNNTEDFNSNVDF